ncbi:MAG: hypothetical protein RL572_352 [Pseudomonadota bacterium]
MSAAQRARAAVLLGLVALLTSAVAAAHQQQAALTRVLFNARSGNLEVMHRFVLHDAEHAVRALLDPQADLLASAPAREQFARYVQERFSLLGDAGNPLPLQYVGQEVDGPFLWVYQELPIPAGLTSLGVIHDALRELWPQQNNLVNIERDGSVQTLNFSGTTQWLSVSFNAPAR